MQRREEFHKRKQENVQRDTTLFDNYQGVIQLRTTSYQLKGDIVLAGITKKELTQLKEIFELDYFTLSCMLAVTERTIHMKKSEENFSQIISDRIMHIAELYSFGYHVFGDRNLFNSWMKRPNRNFLQVAPVDLMHTLIGSKQVENEIFRHQVGLF
jgi:putative toxin-antitoxin system antitoxin component (TIGR02293 family)